MWVGENKSAKFWANVLNSMRNRGVEDILIACTDNLSGFAQAIEAVFPQTDIQNCIIHQLRNSSKYVSYKDLKALMADLKKVYTAVDEKTAMNALDEFAEIWDSKYPKISKSWYDNWANLSTYFKFPQELRKLIYTTNAIEGFNRQLKKVTKAKSVFPTDDSIFKRYIISNHYKFITANSETLNTFRFKHKKCSGFFISIISYNNSTCIILQEFTYHVFHNITAHFNFIKITA